MGRITQILFKYSYQSDHTKAQKAQKREIDSEITADKIKSFSLKTADPVLSGKVVLAKDDIVEILFQQDIKFDYYRIQYRVSPSDDRVRPSNVPYQST
jgi:hypothetical protein